MGSEFTFYDYINEAGENVVHDWLNGPGTPAKAKFTQWLLFLEATPPGAWTRPLVDTLTDQCQGLFEIRTRIARVRYRLIGCHGPGTRSPTLLYGIIKKASRVQVSDCQEALSRKRKAETNPNKHRREHDYS